MKDIPAIEEMREIKERHAAKYGYDIHKMVMALKRQEAKSERKIVHARRRLVAK